MKARIALEAIKEQKTIRKSLHYGVHPARWRTEAASDSERGTVRGSALAAGHERGSLKAELYQQIGQLQVELDWLKKKSGLSR